MSRSDLTPDQLADLTRDHTGAQADLDDLVEAHRVEVAQRGEVLATAGLALHMAEQQSHEVAAGFAAHAVTRLVRVEAERDDALQMLGDLKPEGLAGPRVQLLVWDWKAQPDLGELGRAITDLSAGRVHLAQADTGTDEYAIVLSTTPLDGQAATEAYRRHWEGEPMPAG